MKDVTYLCHIAFTDSRNTASQNRPDILWDEEKDAESRIETIVLLRGPEGFRLLQNALCWLLLILQAIVRSLSLSEEKEETRQ